MKMNTGERLMKVETKIETIETKIDAQAKRNREDFQLVFEKVDSIGERFINRFAGKWVERIVIGIIIALSVGVTGLVIKSSIG